MSTPDARHRPPPACSVDPYEAQVRAAIEESRRFLARIRSALPCASADPDELQVRSCAAPLPSIEHYARLFRAVGPGLGGGRGPSDGGC